MFDLVIAVDWSAASSRGPAKPIPRRVWSAAGTQDHREAPVYHRTRAVAVEHLVDRLLAHRGTALVGLDFAFGYPLPASGPVLPTGRGLCAFYDAVLDDQADDTNNRFEVAAHLNKRIAGTTGGPPPFWGVPSGWDGEGLTATKPPMTHVPEYRLVEKYLRDVGEQPKSVWQLTYAGSVGSQVLTGMAAVHRIIAHPELAKRCRVWPFETDWSRNAIGPDGDTIVIAEIYPSLTRHLRAEHEIEDARQVMAHRDMILQSADQARLLDPPSFLPEEERRVARDYEGWILGAFTGPTAARRG